MTEAPLGGKGFGFGWLTVFGGAATSPALHWSRNDFVNDYRVRGHNESWDDVNVSVNWLGDASVVSN